ncbi:proteophosphoglycan ppg4 [Strigomonas culicis]|uniref:Proteophosphoglycan ppg4 n=1 Tax=Strigomonas culicis TaxID=28005 RepID=S9TF42_9TRYP|nr:proteophosphoglycan ppg4 [Strigomonas culicis]|eukprot:EPY15544.1 proteophosphoglycan ppg4 [Strigomonas culicis]
MDVKRPPPKERRRRHTSPGPDSSCSLSQSTGSATAKRASAPELVVPVLVVDDMLEDSTQAPPPADGDGHAAASAPPGCSSPLRPPLYPQPASRSANNVSAPAEGRAAPAATRRKYCRSGREAGRGRQAGAPLPPLRELVRSQAREASQPPGAEQGSLCLSRTLSDGSFHASLSASLRAGGARPEALLSSDYPPTGARTGVCSSSSRSGSLSSAQRLQATTSSNSSGESGPSSDGGPPPTGEDGGKRRASNQPQQQPRRSSAQREEDSHINGRHLPPLTPTAAVRQR